MATLLFRLHSRWHEVTLTKGSRRKAPYTLELECHQGLALLPLAEEIARTTVHTVAGPSAPVPMDCAHTGNGRNRLEFRLSNEHLAEVAARCLAEIPREWLYNRERLDGQDIDDLACDPIVSGLGELAHLARQSALLAQQEDHGDG